MGFGSLFKSKMSGGPHRQMLDIMRSLIDASSGTIYKTVITGGTAEERNLVLNSMISLARKVGTDNGCCLPAIILHQQNYQLHSSLCPDGKNVRNPGGNRYYLDPLEGFSDEDIAMILHGAAEKIRPAKPELKQLISLGIRFLRAQDKEPTIWEMCRIPWPRLSAMVQEMAENRELRPKDAREFLETLACVSPELGNADMFFSALGRQLGTEPPEGECSGLSNMMKLNGYVCVDLIGGEAKEVKSLWFKLLRRLTLEKKRFLLVLDSISVDDELIKLLEDLGNTCVSILVYPDLPAAAGDKFFSLVGGNTNLAILAHQSAQSAEAIADFFGKSYQMKYTDSTSTTKDVYKLFSTQTTRGTSREVELRYRIPTDTIQTIPRNYLLLHDCGSCAEPSLISLEQVSRIRDSSNILRIGGGR